MKARGLPGQSGPTSHSGPPGHLGVAGHQGPIGPEGPDPWHGIPAGRRCPKCGCPYQIQTTWTAEEGLMPDEDGELFTRYRSQSQAECRGDLTQPIFGLNIKCGKDGQLPVHWQGPVADTPEEALAAATKLLEVEEIVKCL